MGTAGAVVFRLRGIPAAKARSTGAHQAAPKTAGTSGGRPVAVGLVLPKGRWYRNRWRGRRISSTNTRPLFLVTREVQQGQVNFHAPGAPPEQCWPRCSPRESGPGTSSPRATNRSGAPAAPSPLHGAGGTGVPKLARGDGHCPPGASWPCKLGLWQNQLRLGPKLLPGAVSVRS